MLATNATFVGSIPKTYRYFGSVSFELYAVDFVSRLSVPENGMNSDGEDALLKILAAD